MSLRDEQLKLAANWCNIVSAGIVTVGVVAPWINHLLGGTQWNPAFATWSPWVCFFAAGVLHSLGHLVLTWLPEEETDDEQ